MLATPATVVLWQMRAWWSQLLLPQKLIQPLDIARRTGLLTQLTQNSADDVQPDVAHAIDAALAGLPAAPEGDEQMAYSGA